MPGAMEAAEGGAPEVIVHDEKKFATGDELSPEEAAINGAIEVPATANVGDDEEQDMADLAEGRMRPPV